MYAKLFSSITESSLWSEPKEVRLLFVTMLAKADQNGFVEASIPGLARISNLTVEETELALEVLKAPDKYSKNPENEGRRVVSVPGGFVLLNYEDYRARRNEEDRREYMKDYMKEYRKQFVNKNVNDVNNSANDVNKNVNDVNSGKQCKPPLAAVNHGKPPLAHTETETDTETDTKKSKYCALFEQFWKSFPSGRKVAKGAAYDSWKKAVKQVPAEIIIQSALEYSRSPAGKGEYVKMPSTWLNQRCWEDDRAAWGVPQEVENKSSNRKFLSRYWWRLVGGYSPNITEERMAELLKQFPKDPEDYPEEFPQFFNEASNGKS